MKAYSFTENNDNGIITHVFGTEEARDAFARDMAREVTRMAKDAPIGDMISVRAIFDAHQDATVDSFHWGEHDIEPPAIPDGVQRMWVVTFWGHKGMIEQRVEVVSTKPMRRLEILTQACEEGYGYEPDESIVPTIDGPFALTSAKPATFEARGSSGAIVADAVIGKVLVVVEKEADDDDGGCGYDDIARLDVDEWRATYPGEELEGMSIDVLDFGVIMEDGTTEGPEQDWRDMLREMAAEDGEAVKGAARTHRPIVYPCPRCGRQLWQRDAAHLVIGDTAPCTATTNDGESK